MARKKLKCWKKTGTTKNPTWTKGKQNVVMNSGTNYYIVFIKGIPYATKTRSKALKFAKSYMKKHDTCS